MNPVVVEMKHQAGEKYQIEGLIHGSTMGSVMDSNRASETTEIILDIALSEITQK